MPAFSDKVKADALAYMRTEDYLEMGGRRVELWWEADKDETQLAEYVLLEEATALLLEDAGEPFQATACRYRAAWGSHDAFRRARPEGPLGPLP